MVFLRSAAFNLYFIILTLGMGLGAFPVRLSGDRARALRYAQAWTRATIAGLTRICGIEITVLGRENLPAGPCLIASQHQSALDTLVWMNLVPRPAYVMKQELTRIPLVGPMLLLSGMIPVERQAGATALRGLMRATEAAIADQRQIVVFPEGTRTRPGEIVPLQPGVIAMARNAPAIVPVATNSGLFWGRNAFVKRPGRLLIVISPPLSPPQGQAARQALLDTLRTTWDRAAQQNDLFRTVPPPSSSSCG